MARDGLTYEHVERVANALRGQGARVSTRTVLAETGGSATTVHNHLKRWWAEHPEPTAPKAALPPALERIFQEEIERIERAARSAAETKLASAEEEAEDLARDSARLLEENTSIKQQLVDLTAERDRAQGQARQQAAELERLQTELVEERRGAEGARVELAQIRAKLESQIALVDQVRDEVATVRALIEQERSGRLDAERALAGATAAQNELRKTVDTLTTLRKESEAENAQLQQALDAQRTAAADAQRELAACRAENKGLTARSEDLARREQLLQSELQLSRESARKSARTRTED